MTNILNDTISEDEIVTKLRPHYETVGMSMLTMFRCYTGDCNTTDGSPIIVLVNNYYGLLLTIPFILSVLLVTFALFNLVMAVYIEGTLQSAKEQDMSSKAVEKQDHYVAASIRKLVVKLYNAQTHSGFDDSREPDMPDMNFLIERETFKQVLDDKEVGTILDKLEIGAERLRLFDILDGDASGTLSIKELIVGLLRMRGDTQKSDGLAAVLGVQAVLSKMKEVEQQLGKSEKAILANQDEMTSRMGEWFLRSYSSWDPSMKAVFQA